jgi:hypothetical protein
LLPFAQLPDVLSRFDMLEKSIEIVLIFLDKGEILLNFLKGHAKDNDEYL